MDSKKFLLVWLIASLLLSFPLLVLGVEEWLSPNNFLDPDASWTSEGNAYDGDTGTYAYEDISGAAWGNYVYYNFTEVTGNKLRFWVSRDSVKIDDLEIDILNTTDSLWYNVHTGITVDEWVNVTFTSTTSDAMRLRFYESQSGKTYQARINELDFLNVTVLANDPPTNDKCEITDLDDTDDLYAQKQLYTIDYDVSDPDGFADIDYCEVRFKQGVSTRAIFRYDEDTDTFSTEQGGTEWTLDGTSSANEASTYINMTLKVAAQWDALEEADLEIECYVVDDHPESDTDTMQSDYFDVITNLVTNSIECTDGNDPDRVDVSSSIQIDFSVRYVDEPSSGTPSSYYPPDAEFTSISVYDTGDNNKGTDSSIVNGAGSVSFNAESSVTSMNYNLYIDMSDADYSDGEESTTETVISDQIEIVSVAFDDSRVNINTAAEVRYVLRYDYDDASFEGGDGSIVGFTWDAVNSWWDKSVTSPVTPSSENYDENDLGALTDSNYGLTVYEDDVGADLIGDRITFLTGTLEVTDARIDYNTNGEWYAELKYEYDDSEVDDGTVSLNTGSMSWDGGESRWEYTFSLGSVGLESRNIASVSGNAHGITALNSAVTTDSEDIIYDQLEFVSITEDTGDQRIDVSSSFELRYQIRYDYDDVTFDDGKGSISGFVWDSINSWWDDSITGSSSVTSTNYDETYVSVTDSTYGLTLKENVAGVDIITDRIIILTLTANNTAPDVDEYVQLRVTLELEYDSHTLNDGVNDAVSLNDASSPVMSWDGGDSRWEVDDVRASPQAVTYDEVTATEDTYGITVVNMDGKSVVVTWSGVGAYYYLTVYFESGLIFRVNGSGLLNGSENGYLQDIGLNCSGEPENTNWEFLGFERVTYNNFTTDTPIHIDLIANETIWAYSEVEGEPLLYESVWIFSILWVCLVFFSVFKPSLLMRGSSAIIGFILALDIHSSISTTFGSLLGFAVVCINVGLLVSVLFDR